MEFKKGQHQKCQAWFIKKKPKQVPSGYDTVMTNIAMENHHAING